MLPNDQGILLILRALGQDILVLRNANCVYLGTFLGISNIGWLKTGQNDRTREKSVLSPLKFWDLNSDIQSPRTSMSYK